MPTAKPLGALILGSGWSEVADAFAPTSVWPYERLPALGATGVDGHSGRLVLTLARGREILIFQGRRHWYEGAGWEPVALPVYACLRLGVKVIALTNAAGAINPEFAPGDLMLIDDHINMMGQSPLLGPHEPDWGARFPDQTVVYDASLRESLLAAARAVDAHLRRGVYIAAAGPTYETPAEVAAFRRLGADAVGMSTVPEAILAHAAGMRVVGLSCITNMASGLGSASLSHGDVIDAARSSRPRMAAVMKRFFEDLAG
jgi:purine-nucleoside phosphorylase